MEIMLQNTADQSHVECINSFTKFASKNHYSRNSRNSENLQKRVKVVDGNNQLVPFGQPGEMCFRGYMLSNEGYYKEPEKTKAVLSEDGWFHSGDRFALMENGYAQIVGRIKDTNIIIRGGENIQPSEIERVYGVTDARLGEKVAAAVIKKENSNLSESDVKQYCEGSIASYKIPEYIFFCENYPKTASGKIQKGKQREISEKEIHDRTLK
ncbi:putative acyl-CoA synthetase YngI isoform X2 [Planococcus citri]|uniref:putative acyl-CoA synthetase YngI isoform X2 n=1 Tax=Planococcus citri TaxID=170843 RepID=UPI0031F84419